MCLIFVFYSVIATSKEGFQLRFYNIACVVAVFSLSAFLMMSIYRPGEEAEDDDE